MACRFRRPHYNRLLCERIDSRSQSWEFSFHTALTIAAGSENLKSTRDAPWTFKRLIIIKFAELRRRVEGAFWPLKPALLSQPTPSRPSRWGMAFVARFPTEAVFPNLQYYKMALISAPCLSLMRVLLPQTKSKTSYAARSPGVGNFDLRHHSTLSLIVLKQCRTSNTIDRKLRECC